MAKRLEKDLEIHEIRLPVGLLKHDEYLELAIPEKWDRVIDTYGSISELVSVEIVKMENEKWHVVPRLVVKKKEASE